MRLFKGRKSNDLQQQSAASSDLQICENVSNNSSSNHNVIACNNTSASTVNSGTSNGTTNFATSLSGSSNINNKNNNLNSRNSNNNNNNSVLNSNNSNNAVQSICSEYVNSVKINSTMLSIATAPIASTVNGSAAPISSTCENHNNDVLIDNNYPHDKNCAFTSKPINSSTSATSNSSGNRKINNNNTSNQSDLNYSKSNQIPNSNLFLEKSATLNQYFPTTVGGGDIKKHGKN